MDWQTGFTIACGVASAALSLLIKGIREDMAQIKSDFKNLQRTVNDMRADIPEHYVTNGELKEATDRVFKLLERIEFKLDNKMDKK